MHSDLWPFINHSVGLQVYGGHEALGERMGGGPCSCATELTLFPPSLKCNKSLYCVPGLSGSSCLLAEVVWHWLQPWAGGKSVGTHQRRGGREWGGLGLEDESSSSMAVLSHLFVAPVMICSKKGD